jgi:hypothetical protein
MANIWREPIFDRTYDDVLFAIDRIAEWKKSHTHSPDIKVENNTLIIKDGVAYVTETSLVLQEDGVTYVENDVLVVELGTVYDLKGCLNLSDITRIEDNITYLATRLTQYRYAIDINSKEWTKESLPTADDMKRIATNIRSIFTGFIEPSDSAAVSNVMLSYEDINALEYNLYLLKQMLDAMVGSFIKSGTYKSGSTNRLPIRR